MRKGMRNDDADVIHKEDLAKPAKKYINNKTLKKWRNDIHICCKDSVYLPNPLSSRNLFKEPSHLPMQWNAHLKNLFVDRTVGPYECVNEEMSLTQRKRPSEMKKETPTKKRHMTKLPSEEDKFTHVLDSSDSPDKTANTNKSIRQRFSTKVETLRQESSLEQFPASGEYCNLGTNENLTEWPQSNMAQSGQHNDKVKAKSKFEKDGVEYEKFTANYKNDDVKIATRESNNNSINEMATISKQQSRSNNSNNCTNEMATVSKQTKQRSCNSYTMPSRPKKLDELHDRCRASLIALERVIAGAWDLPAYSIMDMAAVKAMSQRLPETEEAMLQIPHVTKKKFDMYGQSFLSITQGYAAKKRVLVNEINEEQSNSDGNDNTWDYNNFDFSYDSSSTNSNGKRDITDRSNSTSKKYKRDDPSAWK